MLPVKSVYNLKTELIRKSFCAKFYDIQIAFRSRLHLR